MKVGEETADDLKFVTGAEEYAGFGTLNDFLPVHDQFHEVWAVFDHKINGVDIEGGVGVGVTAGSDRITLKLMVSRDLNKKK